MASMFETVRPALSRLWNGEAKSVATGLSLDAAIALAIENGGRTSKAGQNVGVMSALGVTTVLCCARVKAEGLAQVPCRLFQKLPNGGRREATEHPLHWLLYRRPNARQTSFEFREQLGFHLALCGNAFVYKVMTPLGRVVELLPFPPNMVTVVWEDNEIVAYRVRLPMGQTALIPSSQMWHIRAASWDGYSGLEPVSLARDAIGLSLAAEEFGSSLFSNGARPSGILTSETTIGPDLEKNIRASWQEANSGGGNHMKTAILQGGLKWTPLAQTADEAQFIEARKMQVVEICRSMRVLPIMAMHQDGTAAYASVEQMFLAHLTHTLGPDFERFEQSAEVNLLSEADQKAGYYVELVESGLMRGTAKDRAETMGLARQHGAATANEFRDALDLPRQDDTALNAFTPAVNIYGDPNNATPPA